MKIALLGAGKTGGKVIEAAKNHVVTTFDENNTPTVGSLRDQDVLIGFVTGDVMLSYVDLLVESGIPVVSGATGIEWPSDLDQRLKNKDLKWISASNFAIGMNLVKAMIKILAKGPSIIPDSKYDLHEVHHIHKLDSPSGTAKSWTKWLGHDVEFSDEREGDVVGIHTLTLRSQFEDISIKHDAKDRSVFASGAVWTAEYLVKKDIAAGLHELSDLMEKELGL